MCIRIQSYINKLRKLKIADPIEAKFREDILEGFEKTGIQLSADKQARLKAIFDELAKIEQEYARNVRDNPEKLEFSPDELKGLPQSYIDGLKKNDKGNYLLGFEYPDYRPFYGVGR